MTRSVAHVEVTVEAAAWRGTDLRPLRRAVRLALARGRNGRSDGVRTNTPD